MALLGGAWGSAKAQVSVYGEFSVSDLHNLVSTDYLYGGTAGLLYDGPTVFKHLLISADIQGRFVRKSPTASLNAELYNGITVGPRFSVPLKHGISPYGEFLVGFARYDSGAVGGSTTDSTIQVNAGVAKKLTSRFDLVADYSYAQYYGLGGQYNPKTYSIGGIFHFTRR
jgi:opacity protein-like surface antigen